MTARSLAGPCPPLDSTHDQPPSGDALRALAAWCDQQVTGLPEWIALPTSQPAPLCACSTCSPFGPARPAPEHRPLFGPPRPIDRWARLRLAQRADQLAQDEAERRRWAAQVPRWRGTTEPTTPARALAVALDPFHPPRPPKLGKWKSRSESRPCRMTVAQPTVAVVGKYPKPVAQLDASHPLAVAESHPLILPPGGSVWLTAEGHVTERVQLDVDGAPIGTGGRSKTSARPSTVPSSARKTPHKVKVGRPGESERQRVWVWLDRFGTVQARTLSGHDVRLSARGRSALAGWLTPRSAETV